MTFTGYSSITRVNCRGETVHSVAFSGPAYCREELTSIRQSTNNSNYSIAPRSSFSALAVHPHGLYDPVFDNFQRLRFAVGALLVTHLQLWSDKHLWLRV